MAVSLNTHPELTSQQGQALVALVRQTLTLRLKRKVAGREAADLEHLLQDPVFSIHCGAFVTLKIGGQLRGCIGSLAGREPLIDCVRTNAINAAFHDPRFGQLAGEELARVAIEVSVLTPPQALDYGDADDLLAKLRPGVDGVTIRKDLAGATFLPQVWDQIPLKERFLEQLCLKAGLPGNAWRNADLEVETYQVQYFEEPAGSF